MNLTRQAKAKTIQFEISFGLYSISQAVIPRTRGVQILKIRNNYEKHKPTYAHFSEMELIKFSTQSTVFSGQWNDFCECCIFKIIRANLLKHKLKVTQCWELEHFRFSEWSTGLSKQGKLLWKNIIYLNFVSRINIKNYQICYRSRNLWYHIYNWKKISLRKPDMF